MQTRATEELIAVSGQDFPILTTAMPINPRDRMIAASVVVVLSIAVAVTAPFATIPLERIDAFLPVIQSVMCVIDLVTAAFLFGQFSIRPRLSLLAIASGYVFSGLLALAQTLAFPGSYAAAGLFGDGVSAAAWLFVLWHSSFDLAVIVYALSKDRGERARVSIGSNTVAIAVTMACILGVTAGSIWIVAQDTKHLPILFTELTNQTSVARGLDAFLWLMSALALSLLFVRRRTILDLWLMVILLAWWPNFVFPIFSNSVRFTLGWDAGLRCLPARLCWSCCSSRQQSFTHVWPTLFFFCGENASAA